MSSVMYYERAMKELKSNVSKIDLLSKEIDNINVKLKPGSKIYCSKAKDIRKRINVLAEIIKAKNETLRESISRKNCDLDLLFNLKLELGKLDSQRVKLYNTFTEHRRKYLKNISKDITKKKHNNKEVKELNHNILDLLRKV